MVTTGAAEKPVLDRVKFIQTTSIATAITVSMVTATTVKEIAGALLRQ